MATIGSFGAGGACVNTLSWDVEEHDGTVHIRLRGELDLATAPGLDRELRRLEADAGLMVVDLRRVTFIDSGGLRTLLLADMRADEDGRRVAIVPSAPVRRALDALGALARGRVRRPLVVDDPAELHPA